MLLTAVFMGLAGSLHCAGMCSPLAMTVANMSRSAFTGRAFYNSGRIAMYAALGTAAAAVGYIVPLSRFQNVLSLALGSTLIIMGAAGVTGVRIPVVTDLLAKFTALLKRVFSKFIYRRNYGAMLLLGSLNGLLPCGLTFIALSVCITLPTPMEGFAFMSLFGIGTLPVMLGLISIVDVVKNKMHWNIKHLTTGLMVLSGLLLIARVFFLHMPASHNHALDSVDIVICR